MVTYTVHEPPDPGSDRADRGVELEFVKDGFSWLTAICPPLGFAANGLWLFALAYLVGAGALGWALTAAKIDPQWIGWIFLAINIYLGFEISTLKRWMLEQTGWEILSVSGTPHPKALEDLKTLPIAAPYTNIPHEELAVLVSTIIAKPK